MKFFLVIWLSGSCGLVWAQTNTAAPKPPEQEVVITSDTGHFDGKTSQMIYLGHVFVTDNVKAKLYCGQLTVDVPPNGSHPNNIVAETDVVIDYLDGKGQTNHITAAKAVYAYSQEGSVTNETVTFTGDPKVESAESTILSEPLIWDRAGNHFIFHNETMKFRQNLNGGGGTNALPVKLF